MFRVQTSSRLTLLVTLLAIPTVLTLALRAADQPAKTLPAAAEKVGTQQLKGHLIEPLINHPLIGKLEPTTNMQLAIGLPLRNQAELDTLIGQISDPQAPQYRQYRTPAQFAEQFGPTADDYQAVIAFAKAQGLTVTRQYDNRMVLDVSGTADQVNKAFYVTLMEYKRPDGSIFHAPDREPSLDLKTPILHINGLENYAPPRFGLKGMSLATLNAKPGGGTGPGGSLGGNDFRNAYVPGTKLIGTGQTIALLEFDGFFPNDIAQYKNTFKLPNVPVQTILLNGYNGSANGGNLEVALDIDMAIAMAPGISRVLVYEGTNPDSILSALASPPPGVPLSAQISSSWVWTPFDSVAPQLLKEFAAQGQSFFNCSMDSGAYPSDPLDNRDGPDITIVGGTALTMNGKGTSWESESTWSGGGGGILTSNPIPPYQAPVSMKTNNGSAKNRNAPDVSMVATGLFIYYNNGTGTGVLGTSIAAPLWAGFMALANQQAKANGLGTVGFANPALYDIGRSKSYSADFHDINDGSSNTSNGNPKQYSAVTGYDLATGWGSPKLNLINELNPIPTAHQPPITNPNPVPTQFTSIVFSIGTGGDDLRGDSAATVDLIAPNAAKPFQTVTLKGKNQGSWANNSQNNNLAFKLTAPQPVSGIGSMVLHLVQGGSFPETADNWKVQTINVSLTNASGQTTCLFIGKGNPFVELTGSSGSITLTPASGCP